MKTESKTKTGNNKPQLVALQDINRQIEELQQKRIGLAQPLKDRYAELKNELLETERLIKELDPSFRPGGLKPQAVAKITELITAKGQLTADEITKELSGVFTAWKTKSTLKQKSSGARAVFTVDSNGRYGLKPTA